jgi:hypothetical protein
MDQFYRQGPEEALVAVEVMRRVLDMQEQLAHSRAAVVAVVVVEQVPVGLAVLAAQAFALELACGFCPSAKPATPSQR